MEIHMAGHVKMLVYRLITREALTPQEEYHKQNFGKLHTYLPYPTEYSVAA